MTTALRSDLLAYDGSKPADLEAAILISNGIGPDGNVSTKSGTFRVTLGQARHEPSVPLVSCLMPTKNRIDQAKIAVACYRRQTWPRRELIILDQGNGGLGKWVDSLGDPTIKYHAMLGLDEPLGSIRNRTIDLSSGDIFCTWDDDDMHHRARIEVAMSALLASKTAAFLLRREWFWMPYERRIGVREPLLYCNALLTWRKAGLRYPPIQKGEDRQAVLQLMKSQPVLLADIPELYLYVAHGSNTVRQSYLETQWNTASDRSQDDAADATLLQLAAAFPISEYANALYAARSPHEVAAH